MTNQFDITIESIIFTFILLYVSEWILNKEVLKFFQFSDERKDESSEKICFPNASGTLPAI